MTDTQPFPAEDTPNTPHQPVQNPFIINFCRALVEKKGEKHEPAALKQLLDNMYKLYESLLGQNMVNALPDDKRQEYLALCENLENLNYEKIGEIFGKHVPNYQQIMKATMKQLADLYMKNRNFNPEDHFEPTNLKQEQ